MPAETLSTTGLVSRRRTVDRWQDRRAPVDKRPTQSDRRRPNGGGGRALGRHHWSRFRAGSRALVPWIDERRIVTVWQEPARPILNPVRAVPDWGLGGLC